ncbi:MAG: carbohydrate-binding protein, partial [Candidatus Omnitrophica bacterium]|nr:carbohydrate-binding protein [Candidatus Omnitrophota bacterium]
SEYVVADTIEFLEPIPVSTNEIPWNPGIFRPDYRQILSRVNICDAVDQGRVSQVWLWGYHYGNLEPAESNTAMGIKSQPFWNYGSYGDMSNSEQIDDMPTCLNTYTLYNYNYGRQLGELLEDHGHHIESVMRFVELPLWETFVRPYGDPSTINRCGWTHSPPNTPSEYDWWNEADVQSDCEDWKPEGFGQVRTVDCHTWYGPTCLDNGGIEFKIWWMQNIPGLANQLPFRGGVLRNWWEFYEDFDAALALGKYLGIPPPVPVPGRWEAEAYKAGGEGIGYHDTTVGNTAGVGRFDDVDIELTADVQGGYYNVGWTDVGEWLAYDVDSQLPSGSRYTFTARVSSGVPGTKVFHVTVDGLDVTGPILFTDASGWQSWQDVQVTGIVLSSGPHELRVIMDTPGFGFNYFALTAESP